MNGCPNCGAPVEPRQHFCIECGEATVDETTRARLRALPQGTPAQGYGIEGTPARPVRKKSIVLLATMSVLAAIAGFVVTLGLLQLRSGDDQTSNTAQMTTVGSIAGSSGSGSGSSGSGSGSSGSGSGSSGSGSGSSGSDSTSTGAAGSGSTGSVAGAVSPGSSSESLSQGQPPPVPAATQAVELLEAYRAAFNAADVASARTMTTSDFQAGRAFFTQGPDGTQMMDFEVLETTEIPTVKATFTSQGSSCLSWHVEYKFVPSGGSYLIADAERIREPQPC